MKKAYAVLLTLFLMGQVMALPKPGITPDSWLYGFKRFFESIDLALTFDEAAKAEKYFKYAEVRLAETKEMIEKGKLEYVQGLVEEYEKMLNRSLEIAEKAKERGVNVTEVVALSTATHLDVLEEVYNIVSDEARPAIERAMNASKRGSEEALSALREYRPERAVEIYLQILEEKLAGAPEAGGEAEGEYQRMLNETQNIIEELKNYGKDTSRWEQQLIEITSNPRELGEVPGTPGIPEAPPARS